MNVDYSLICKRQFEAQTQRLYDASWFLVAAYWGLFIVAASFCQKIYAVETMFAFQLAYLSSIPVGVFCPPFTSLGVWRYSFGWNGLPF